jgi:hypothetical protein
MKFTRYKRSVGRSISNAVTCPLTCAGKIILVVSRIAGRHGERRLRTFFHRRGFVEEVGEGRSVPEGFLEATSVLELPGPLQVRVVRLRVVKQWVLAHGDRHQSCLRSPFEVTNGGEREREREGGERKRDIQKWVG